MLHRNIPISGPLGHAGPLFLWHKSRGGDGRGRWLGGSGWWAGWAEGESGRILPAVAAAAHDTTSSSNIFLGRSVKTIGGQAAYGKVSKKCFSQADWSSSPTPTACSVYSHGTSPCYGLAGIGSNCCYQHFSSFNRTLGLMWATTRKTPLSLWKAKWKAPGRNYAQAVAYPHCRYQGVRSILKSRTLPLLLRGSLDDIPEQQERLSFP